MKALDKRPRQGSKSPPNSTRRAKPSKPAGAAAPRPRKAQGPAGSSGARTLGYLYDAAGRDRDILLTQDAVSDLHDGAILWVDLPRRDRAEIGRIAALLGLDHSTADALGTPRDGVRLDNYGTYLQFAVLAASAQVSAGAAQARRGASNDRRIDFLVGRNWVLTVHSQDIAYVGGFRAQHKADTGTGALSASALSASLLDWHLEEYFAEVSHIEAAIDELDERILAAPSEEGLLEEILAIRRRSTRLRRALMAQRTVFYGLGRPDLGPSVDPDAAGVFAALASRFERAVDEAEHTRDLSVGSFELFTSRSAQQTNDLVKALTFFTVVIGTTAAVAGLFGMNFDPPFFQTGSIGFLAVTLGLLALGLAAWIVGRRRSWI